MGRCRNCGAALPDGARFCPSCGTPVADDTAAEERKLVTVLFADVVGSTGLGERLDAENLKEVMDSYFAAMRAEIEAEGGTVEKFIGDAVMSVFGVPIAHEDDPARALRAALRMRDRLEHLNHDLSQRYGVALEMRVGVNTGDVLAVTSPKPGEAMVAGDTVNIAARLQQAADPGEVIVAERVARATRGFAFEEIAPLTLKGKRAAVRALRLARELAHVERGLPGLSAPLIGRQAEMALLDSLFDRAVQEQRPDLVTVFGDAGVGKSRLVAEFTQRVERRPQPPLLLSGRCLPYGDGVTYWPLAEILKGLAGVMDSDPPDMVVGKIRKLGHALLTPDVTPDPLRATAALAYTLGVEDPDVPLRDLAPRQVRSETHAAWRSMFSALATERPLMLMIEDIHWADAAMLDLLEDVAERAQGAIVLICPARPELTNKRPTWGGGRRNYTSIFLDPLTGSEAEEFVGSLLAIEGVPTKLRRQILERAEGNPFFLEEILRHLIDEGVIIRDGDSCSVETNAADVIVPDTVQAVLAARIDLLPAEEKRALQSAAVVGRVFWAGAVATLLGREDVDDLLDGLERRELIRSRLVSTLAGDREYIFKHVLTRDVGYESIPRRDRSAAHARAAEWLERTALGREREVAELLASHFAQAYQPLEQDRRTDAAHAEEVRSKAIEYSLLAAEIALGKLALDNAERYADQALALARTPLERSRALVALGLAYKNGYRGERSWAALREAVDARVEATPDDHLAIIGLCATALEIPARWPGSMRTMPPSSELARYLNLGMEHAGKLPKGDSEELVRLMTVRAFWSYVFSDDAGSDEELDAAEKDGMKAAEMARRLGRPDLESAALDGAQSNLMARDRHGLIDMSRRIELADVVQDPWEIGDTFAMAAWMNFMQGRYRETIRYALEGIERSRQGGSAPMTHCLSWAAMARYRLGEWRAFLTDMAEIEDALGDRRAKPPHWAARPFAAATVVHEIRGNRQAADAYLAIITELERSERSHFAAPWTAVVMARRGHAEDGLKLLSRVENVSSTRSWRGLLLEARCEMLISLERWAEARGAANDARLHGRAAGLLAPPLMADRTDGMVALAEERWDDAVTLLTAASDGYGELEARWDQARTDIALAEALARTGRVDDARDRIARSVAVFEVLGAAAELSNANEILSAL